MPNADLEALTLALRRFAAERDWDQFHSPRNLATALAVEASELLEHFQWMRDGESTALDAKRLREVSLETADVFLYLLRLSDKLGIDLVAVAHEKIALNAAKYPVEQVRGSSRKYTEYPRATQSE